MENKQNQGRKKRRSICDTHKTRYLDKREKKERKEPAFTPLTTTTIAIFLPSRLPPRVPPV